MNEITISKKTKLRLNKATIVHLNPRQMARVGSGNNPGINEQTNVKCYNGHTGQDNQCNAACFNGPTHDTGIPPGQTNRTN
ncbi:MAG: hypothetical protein QG657_4784 [Acidobacteriota bacterium]|nr:hypothetical protein [Acidobacteriota bacterium]